MENNNQKGPDLQPERATTIYEVFIYALMYATIFAYLYEDISYNFILFIMVIVHVFFGLKMNNIFDNSMKYFSKIPDVRDQNFIITIIPIIVIGSLIIRTLSLSIYTFGYTNANIKSHNLGDKYNPPKKYKIPEESYKLSYIVSTICMFILFIFYFFVPDFLLGKDVFDMAYILYFPMMAFIAFMFIFDNLFTFNINYQTVLIMIGIIVLIMGILLTTIQFNADYDILPSLLLLITGTSVGYLGDIDYSSISGQKISINGRLYGSISGYIISLVVPFIFNTYPVSEDINILSKGIVGITSGTLIITTIYEMINALDYEKYHHKIEDYKKTEKDDETEADQKKKTFVNTLLNIIIFIVCAFLIFLILLYAFGINGKNILFSGVISLLIAMFFSYNSFVSSIISTSF
jgi:hypothetical protein